MQRESGTDSAEDRIAIASSKVKLALLTAGALLFVAGGIWLFDIADTQRRYAPIYVKGVSLLAIGFFGLCALYGLLKLLMMPRSICAGATS